MMYFLPIPVWSLEFTWIYNEIYFCTEVDLFNFHFGYELMIQKFLLDKIRVVQQRNRYIFSI